ncbi:CRTAC1 family protein [Saprospiraceae bacterium]|nr:CRTAC1 family protein [Saprospiraceae bacterium]
MKWIKRIFFSLITILLLVVLAAFIYMKSDTKIPYDRPDPMPVDVPMFSEADLNFTQKFNAADHLPVMGAGIIDINNDGQPELWFGGGEGQQDGLFQYSDGNFVDITEGSGFTDKEDKVQSYGPAVYDMDGDGDQDILICRDSGVFLYTNNNGKFKGQKLNLKFDEKSTPIAVTCGDINKDGNIDLFVSTYLPKKKMEGQTIFLQEGYGANSRLFANRGNNKFEDITEASGMSYTHNTFMAIFIDLDGDSNLDIAAAYDTGEPRLYRNLGNEKFVMAPNPMTGKYGYPMGIGVGDYNSDGRPDLFYSNTGSTMPTAILKGDLDLDKQEFNGKWLMFRNDGNFKFTDTAKETEVADYEFSWGALFEDFNLDGLQDLVVAENYVGLPLFKLAKSPCRFLLNTPSNKFVATGKESGVANPNYAISPLTADFNNDGYPDLVYSNIAGRSRAFINKGGDKKYLKVNLQQTPKALGAKVIVTKSDGKKLTDWLVVGEGLGSDQSHTLVFGLGDATSVSNVKIVYADGSEQSISNPKINQTLNVELPKMEESVVDSLDMMMKK